VSSIRRFLIFGALAVLTLFSFIAALRGYQSSMEEAETLFDAQLLDLSRLVANLETTPATRDLRLGNNLAFQVWEHDRLGSASHQAPTTPITSRVQGFEFANFGGFRWRTYTRHDEGHDRWIMVAERSDLRFLLAENIVLETVLPILLGIPVTGLLIWWVVSKGLRPLEQLSEDLQHKPAHDLTPLAASTAPRELKPVVRAINGLIGRLGAALEREKRLSADAAHELRTPIAALKVQLHNLSREIDVHSDSFQQLEEGVDRMGHLMEQLTALYRTSPEQFSEHRVQLDLYALAQETVAYWYPLFQAKGQTLELVGAPAQIRGDPFALDTLLANLISNASKYTPAHGHVQVSVKTLPGGVVELLVQDDGPGIDAAEHSRIFERFYRADHAIEGVPGCGLGLTIVQHVAELHQATVTVGSSSFKTGAAFRVVFPAEGRA